MAQRRGSISSRPGPSSVSFTGEPMVDALENNKREENYASRFIRLMCEKEPQLKIAWQLALDFYSILKTKK